MGDWLRVNGEAIYGTRPWVDGSPQDFTADGTHVRYTTQGDSLYAIIMKWESGGRHFPVFVRKRAPSSACSACRCTV